MKNKFIKIITSPIILIVIALLTHFRWFSFDIFSSGDWWYFTPYAMKEYFPLSIWYSLFGFGNVDITLWRVPVINLPFGTFGYIGLGQEVAEKFTVFWPSIIIGNLAIFILAKKIFKSNVPSIISVLVFNYNTYYLGSTHLLLYAAGSWAVLSLYFFIESLEKRKLHYALVTGILLFVITAYDLRATYITLMIYFFYFCFHTYLSNHIISKTFVRNVIYTIVPLIVFGLLSIYWILPISNASSLVSNQVLSRPLFGNEFLNLLYAITLYHPFWTGSYAAIFENQPIALQFWLIPIAALMGLILNRRNSYVLFFGLLTLLGILLTKQVGAPFTELYKNLFDYVPGFGAFREASKFYFLVILGYSILLGSLVSWLMKNFSKTNRQRAVTALVTLIITFLFLLNIKPYISGEIKSMYVARQIPNGYQTINTFLINKHNYSRTLWVPIFTRWAANNHIHPSLSIVDLIPLWESYVKKEIDSLDYSSGEITMKLLQKEQANNLLDYSSIQYIIVPPQEEKNEDFFLDYFIERDRYIQELNNISYLTPIKVGTNEFAVYENKNFRPHIYLTEKEITLDKDMNDTWQEVNSEFISQSEYKIEFKNVRKPFYLHFTENYHPEWRLKAADLHWFELFNKRNYLLSESEHFKNAASYNSFRLDPNVICRNSEVCKQNNDGTYNMNFSLYFRPQAYLYLGSLISIFSFISIIGFILFRVLRRGDNGKRK